MRAVVLPLALALLACSPITCRAAPDPALNIYAKPQRLIDIGGGRRMNITCLGSGSPTVILEAGSGGWALTWNKIHSELARTTTVCAYDRAGLGFSDPGPLPRTSGRIAADLEALLKNAAIKPPYVLVAHSAGSLHARLFADKNLKDVAGMVLIDPSMEYDQKRLADAIPKAMAETASLLASMQKSANDVDGGLLKPDDPAAATSVEPPDPNFPNALNIMMRQRSTIFVRTLLSEYDAMNGAGSDEVAAARRSYGSMPLIVLTAGIAGPPKASPVEKTEFSRIWNQMHDELAALSTRGINRVVEGAHHMMWEDNPQAVITAVNEVVQESRSLK